MHNIVDTIVRSFTKEELREFKYFLKGRENVLSERSDIKMVDEIRKGKVGSEHLNAVYQTKKRLKKQLELFLHLQSVKQNKKSAIINQLEVGRYLFKKELYREAWYYLRLAEQEAMRAEEYELLDYVYYTHMTYALRLWPIIDNDRNVPQLIHKRDANVKLSRSNADATAAYVLLLHEIRELFSREVFGNIDAVIKKILKHYHLEDRIYDSPKIYVTIVNMVCRVFRENKDYEGLKVYSVNSFKLMKKRKMLDKISSEHLMELLRSIYQASIRTKDYATASSFQKVYDIEKERFISQHSKYIYFDFRSFIMAADLCMFTARIEEAKKILLSLDKKYAAQNKNAIVYFLLRINLLALFFKLEDYDECTKIYSGLIQQYGKQVLKEEGLGLEMLLYTETYGVILSYEKEEFEYALYLIGRMKKRYSKDFRTTLQREFLFLRIIEKMIKKPDYHKTPKYKEEVSSFVKLKEYIPGDKEYISLNAWLESKLTASAYYACFLKHAVRHTSNKQLD